MAPLVAMHTLGHDFMPPGIHAGGLRYHGMAPLVSHAQNEGLIRAEAYGQLECFAAGIQFAKAEGILPAPEPTVCDPGRDQGRRAVPRRPARSR